MENYFRVQFIVNNYAYNNQFLTIMTCFLTPKEQNPSKLRNDGDY